MAIVRRPLVLTSGIFKNIDIAGLFFLLALGLLAPIASNTVLPIGPDHANHTALIVQAKQALDEGQWPLRVAPFQHDGLRYPIFQFYSSTPYLFAALIYKYIIPSNPWLSLKVIYFLGLYIAGIFTFKVGQLLGFSRVISALMGVVYITSPYVLINIHPRGAYTEAFAQFVIPLLAYSIIRLTLSPTRLGYLWTCLAWLLFGTSHIITFVYGTCFYVALIALLYLFHAIRIRTVILLLISAVLGWFITAYQWFAAATIRPLQIHAELGNIFAARWLTPLSMLVSLTGTPPEPLGRQTTPFLYPAIGVPILISVASIFYFRRRLGHDAAAVWPLMIVFSIAFACVWSPVDFWRWLPEVLRVAQFSYRFLIYIVAFGCVLFGYFLTLYGRQHGSVPFLAVLVPLILLAQPFLPTLPRNVRSLKGIIATPDIGYGQAAYLYSGEIPNGRDHYSGKYESPLPLVYGDGWLMLGTSIPVAKDYIEQSQGYLLLRGTAAALPGTCKTLELTLDGKVIASSDVSPVFEWRVPVSAFQPFEKPTGKMGFQSRCGFVPSELDHSSSDHRWLWIRVRTLEFANPLGNGLPLSSIRPHCHIVGSSVDCEINVLSAAKAQLPVLYYPSLLTIRVNGETVQYEPSSYRNFILAQISLQPGRAHISASFTGSKTGNILSILGVVAAILVAYRFGIPKKPPGLELAEVTEGGRTQIQ